MENESRIEEIKEAASHLEQDSISFMEPGTKKKRGPYKKKKKTVEKDQPERESPKAESTNSGPSVETVQFFRPVVAFSGKAVAAWAGTPQALPSPDEIDLMSQGFAGVVDKYLPSMLDQYGAEVLLAYSVTAYSIRAFNLKRVVDAEKAKQHPQPFPSPTHVNTESGNSKGQHDHTMHIMGVNAHNTTSIVGVSPS